MNCMKHHMARFHNIRKRPNTRACPHCNGRLPINVPKWLYSRCQAQQYRCENPNSSEYERYGARGIKFLFEHPNAAAHWIAENIGIADRKMHIDRIDNDGHYEPGNLRWVTPSENMDNTCRPPSKHRFRSFREKYQHIKYADVTLQKLICRGLSDEQIIERYHRRIDKRSGIFSMRGRYRDLP